MKRALITALIATAGVVATAGPVDAAPPTGNQCQQAGMATLKSLGLFSAVARDGIEVDDVGVLPLATVLSLHRNEPQLFRTGGVSVVVPGLGTVPATWCNGL